MSEAPGRCSICQALLDEEDLFCANCGAEAPHQQTLVLAAETTRHVFSCNGCGASMSYDASAQALRCPFCGGGQLQEEEESRTIAPQRIVVAQVSQETANASLRTWLGKGFFRPSDLARLAVVTRMTLVYVPYWAFRAQVHTYWTADSSATPPGARGSWVPVFGERTENYDGVLVGASSVLTPAELQAIAPFDLAQGVPRESFDLDNVIYERFRVPRKYARPQAYSAFQRLESQAVQSIVPGLSRNVRVNSRFEGLSSEPVLLPFWILAYTYQGQVFRFLINAQTGKSTGTAPTSWWKVAAVVGTIVAVILMALVCSGVCAGIVAL